MGTSSDEEDLNHPETIKNPKNPMYQATRKAWVSESLVSLNREVDELADLHSRSAHMRGSRPHRRYRGRKRSKNYNAMPYLPVNAYKQHWYNSILEYERADLQANQTPHPF